MGFNWDEYNDAAADYPKFLTKEERNELIRSGEPFEISAVRLSKTKQGNKFFLTVEAPDLGKRTLSFDEPSFDRRDNLLKGMIDYFAQNGSNPLDAKLTMWGDRAIGLEPVK